MAEVGSVLSRAVDEREAAAVHEAGHAVVGAMLGLELGSITIDGGHGATTARGGQRLGDQAVAAAAAAGDLAEWRRYGDADAGGDDEEMLSTIAARSGHEVVREGARLALEIVDKAWPLIEQLAERLVRDGSAPGSEVAGWVRSSMGLGDTRSPAPAPRRGGGTQVR